MKQMIIGFTGGVIVAIILALVGASDTLIVIGAIIGAIFSGALVKK